MGKVVPQICLFLKRDLFWTLSKRKIMLELKNVKKFYGHFCALDGLNINIPEGSLFGFVGPNGAGKTTALKIMAGILFPDAGSIEVSGLSPERDMVEYKRMIGYVPEDFGIYSGMKVSEYMEFFAACSGLEGFEARKRSHDLLEYVELKDRMDFHADALSTGMKQRLSLARALINDPPVLIMDEPTSGLDPRTRYEFKQIVAELADKGKTIVISSHILSDISELCTDIGIIDQGTMILEGRLMDVMKQVTGQNPLVISMYKKTTQAIKYLKGNEKVKSLSIHGNDLVVGFDGGQSEEAGLLKEMIETGLPVRSFSRQKGSLESLFMLLTGHTKEETILVYDAENIDRS